MHGFFVDLRQSVRGFLREPGFTAIAVLALAVGVGSSTAMFSVVDAALLRPLPYTAPERQLLVTSLDGNHQRVPMGNSEFLELQKLRTTLDAFGAFFPHTATITSPSGPRQAWVANVSASLFRTLGIQPVLGRAFEPAEDIAGGPPVVIVSDAFWRKELGADPAVLGRTLEVDWSGGGAGGAVHQLATIIGVLPRGVAFPRLPGRELFLPLGIPPEHAAIPGPARNGLYGFARLKPGVTAAAAKAEMSSIVHALTGYDVDVEPLFQWVTADAAPALRAAFAGVLLLLVIACANVALLLLMRGTARGRDLAIRAALGGGRSRVALQQVSEGVLLALAGGALGLGIAAVAVRGVAEVSGVGIARLHEVQVDARMAAFALLASAISGALAGAASAGVALRSDLFLLLKDGGVGATPGSARSRVRDALVVAQLAIALLLATGAGLLLRSLERLSAVPLGFEPNHLLTTFVRTQGASSAPALAQLLAAARAIPGVENAALVGTIPFELGRGWSDSVMVEGRNPTLTTPDYASLNWCSPGFLATTGMRLIKGRDLAPTDTGRGSPVALVNETFVARYLADREPIGALFKSYDWPETTFAIVGVVQDVRQWGPAEAAIPEVYLPELLFARNEAAYRDGAMLVVRSRLPPGRVESALRSAGAPLDSQVRVGATRPVDEYLGSFFRKRRFQLQLAMTFAAAALGLAALGVYGAMAFSVVQRRRELAVRAALGAQRRQLSALVLARGARLAVLGIALGVGGALALGRFLSALLYGVGQRDPLTFAVATLTLGAVALAASVLPALAASRLDPMTVLRSE
jgi:putative ABC transport system permease protein